MLSASCYFRGNFSTPSTVAQLLEDFCSSLPELIPDYWNIFEPINLPFNPNDLQNTVSASTPSKNNTRALVFFRRKTRPRLLMSLDLRLTPAQGTTAHNCIDFTFKDKWQGGEDSLARYLPRSVPSKYIDFASIPDWRGDSERYAEFRRSYTPEEFRAMCAIKRPITAPFGPYGCLADVHWFNYFGREFVEAIGKARLMKAGWARVEEVGDGLACFATEKIDDSNQRERRYSITKAIEEFVWTPGCKPEEKRILEFDFSEQIATLPAEVAESLYQPPTSTRLHLAGFSAKEEKEMLRVLGLDEASGKTENCEHQNEPRKKS